VQLAFDGLNNATIFKTNAGVIGSVYGTSPLDWSFASESDGIKNVFVA